MEKAKRRLGLILAAVMVLSTLCVPALAADDGAVVAVPAEYTLAVDGKTVSLWAYEIGGGTYFKLRDLAMALNGTEKRFDIFWIPENKEVNLGLGEAYTPVGGELARPARAGNAEARYTDYSIRSVEGWGNILAYLVDDAHYVKLSDLAAVLKVASSYDGKKHTAEIDTTPDAAGAGKNADAFDNIGLLGAGNSYFLDRDGHVFLSYHNGETVSQAPLVLRSDESGDESVQRAAEAGFYISEEKTAIAYGGLNGEPVYVITSGDKGKTWKKSEVVAQNVGASQLYVGFNSPDDGFLVVGNFHGMGHEDHYLYRTADGGKTWTQIGNPNSLYARVATGACFATDQIGFLSFRYETDFQPAIVRTLDGGYTWEKLEVELPKEFDAYSKTPLSPVFDGENGLFPVQMSDDSGDPFTIWLESGDSGRTWTYDEAYSLACRWAQAVKDRDGRAQYALLSAELQAERYDDYVAFDWVTGASSPWVGSFLVRRTDDGAEITYWWRSSTGPDGVSTSTLTFVREDGALRIDSVTGTGIKD